jgi:(p)ppGpp synthase/HD superfamily hydrolase
MEDFTMDQSGMDVVRKAQVYAMAAHAAVGQKRKYSGDPYWTHTEKVAELVYNFCYGKVAKYILDQMIKAAMAHDIIEDVTPCNPTYSEDYIFNKIGVESFAMVKDLTDIFTKENFPNKNRAARKELEALRLSTIPIASKIIKLCDMFDNTRDIASQDKNFARVYIKEKLIILSLMNNFEFEKERDNFHQIFDTVLAKWISRAFHFVEFELDSLEK